MELDSASTSKRPMNRDSIEALVLEEPGDGEMDIAQMLQLTSGAVLEVKWDMVSEETGEAIPRWWSCVLGEAVGKHTLADEEEEGGDEDPEVCTVFEIEYAAYEPDYPEKSKHRVRKTA